MEEPNDELRVNLLDEVGLISCRGQLHFASEVGASVCFPNMGAVLAVGGEARLEFCRGALVESLAVRVRQRADGMATRRYVFDFLDVEAWKRLEPQLSCAGEDRRRSVRVPPPVGKPIMITMTDRSGEFCQRVPMFDVSTTGVGLRVSAELEQRLRCYEEICLSFYLPTSNRRLFFDGIIENRRMSDEVIHYGIDFVVKDSDVFSQQIDAVRRYCAERQVQMIGT